MSRIFIWISLLLSDNKNKSISVTINDLLINFYDDKRQSKSNISSTGSISVIMGTYSDDYFASYPLSFN